MAISGCRWALTDRNHTVIGMIDAAAVTFGTMGQPITPAMLQRNFYTPFGKAQREWLADVDADGDIDADDVQKVIDGSGSSLGDPGYSADLDIDADGAIGASDLLHVTQAITNGPEVDPDDPFGAAGVEKNALWRSRCLIGYAGTLWDGHSALWLMRNRWYDPDLGTWITRDPAGYVDGMCLYRYVRGNPLVYFDPFGLQGWAEFVVQVSTFVAQEVAPRVEHAIVGASAGASAGAAFGGAVGGLIGDGVGAAPGALIGAAGGSFSGALSGVMADPSASNADVAAQAAVDGAVAGIVGPMLQAIGPAMGLGGKLLQTAEGVAVGAVEGTAEAAAGASLAGAAAAFSQGPADGEDPRPSSDIERLPNDRISKPPKERGKAPTGDDGKPVEIHHEGQIPNGPKKEMTRTDHRGKGNFKSNHENTGQSPSKVDPKTRDKQRREHWNNEWDSGRWNDTCDGE